jgi:hypothetical protein
MPIGIDVNLKRFFDVIRAVESHLAAECDNPRVQGIEFLEVIHYEIQM